MKRCRSGAEEEEETEKKQPQPTKVCCCSGDDGGAMGAQRCAADAARAWVAALPLLLFDFDDSCCNRASAAAAMAVSPAAAAAAALDAALCVDADAVFRPAAAAAASSSDGADDGWRAPAATAPAANRLVAESDPRVGAALRRRSSQKKQQPPTKMHLLLGSSGAPLSKTVAEGLKFEAPEARDAAAAAARANRARMRGLLLWLCQSDAKGVAEHVSQRVAGPAPLPTMEQYGEVLPRQPLHERDVQTRRLFAQNAVLLDALDAVAAASSAPAAVPAGIVHTAVSLLASAASALHAVPPELLSLAQQVQRQGPSVATEGLAAAAETACVAIRVLRRAGRLPWPVSHADELLWALPGRSAWAVLASMLRHVLVQLQRPQQQSSATADEAAAESAARCVHILRREALAHITTLGAAQCARFFSLQP